MSASNAGTSAHVASLACRILDASTFPLERIHAFLEADLRASATRRASPRWSSIPLVKRVQSVSSTNDNMYRVYPSILFLLSLCLPLVRSFICNGVVYGSPKVDDCKQALLELPFAREPHSYQARYPHVFVEPQFQNPQFLLVTNDLRPHAIVQLRKIWKHSKSPGQTSHPPSLTCICAWLSSDLRLLPHSVPERRCPGQAVRSCQPGVRCNMGTRLDPICISTNVSRVQPATGRMEKIQVYSPPLIVK